MKKNNTFETKEKKNSSLAYKIFINTFVEGLCIFIVCIIVFMAIQYRNFENQIFDELEVESGFIIQGIKKSNFQFFSDIGSKNRITIISDEGNVLFDSLVDYSNLEDHASRKEVIEAQKNGIAKISRYSNTMTKKTLYFAQKTNIDGVDYIVRISCDQKTVWIMLLQMSQFLGLLLFTIIIFTLLFSLHFSNKISCQINSINLDSPKKSFVFDELKPFVDRIAEENYEKSQREELRKQFTANVSHELKTPLTSISGFAEILMNGNSDKKMRTDFASRIYDESQRMIVLVNDIIKLGKLDEKNINLEKEEISLRQVVQSVFETLKPLAEKKKVSLNLFGDSGKIVGVYQVLYEMVYNLVDNAIKYNIDEGLVDVSISSNSKENTITLCVKDTGIGIPPAEQERIFERFYRIDKSRSRQLGGTGLGLSIVKHAALFHNAKVYVKSAEKKRLYIHGCFQNLVDLKPILENE